MIDHNNGIVYNHIEHGPNTYLEYSKLIGRFAPANAVMRRLFWYKRMTKEITTRGRIGVRG
jgi:hypothetical protein